MLAKIGLVAEMSDVFVWPRAISNSDEGQVLIFGVFAVTTRLDITLIEEQERQKESALSSRRMVSASQQWLAAEAVGPRSCLPAGGRSAS